MNPFSVRNKLIISVSFILCIPCALIGWVSYKTAYEQITDKTMEGLERNLFILDTYIDKMLSLPKEEVSLLAQSIKADNIETNQGDEDSEIREIIDRFQSLSTNIIKTRVTSHNGAFMSSPHLTLPSDYNPLEQGWYKLAVENPGIVSITAPRLSESNKPVVTMSRQTRDKKGVVAVSISLEDLTRSVSQLTFAEGDILYILDPTGKIVAHPQEKLAEKPKGNYYDEILRNSSGDISFKVNGNLKKAIFLTNAQTGWRIIAEIDQLKIAQSVKPIFNITLFVLLIAICLTSILISIIVRSITKPLQVLVDASEKVSEGDLSGHVIITSQDEFQKLGDAYNHMIDSLSKFALYDPLTNLPNRRQFVFTLEQAITQARSEQSKFAIIFIDVDNFKQVNDTLGHSAGDELLQKMAEQLQSCIGSQGMVARLGGDEFVIFLENSADHAYLEKMLSTLRDSFVQPFTIHGQITFVQMSMGIASYPIDGVSQEELLKHADIAMYKAKELGGNNHRFFDDKMNELVIKKDQIERMMRLALARNEFNVHYQPQIESTTGKIRGFEALVRWNSPELGFVSPEDFVPIAEKIGLITQIDEWVMYQACLKNVELQHQFGYPFLMAVNISALQLGRADFVDKVQLILNETKMKPEHLEIEITESILVESFESSICILRKLENLGVKIAQDDFGTGYSSLNYLKLLPIHTLKIDKSLIQNMTSATAEKTIIESIIHLAHKLGHDVVAEGVETKEQYILLKEWNCDFVQGYYFSRPVSEDKLVELLIEEKNSENSKK
ncbi:EAL domain-containing protein [Lysinibacillus sp. UGB7]|uniref:EAL domain-containing protein n=1 Tax=Lysinibacillus sp. UGB7 TaxID=3411039 RepID=UPI003B7A759E